MKEEGLKVVGVTTSSQTTAQAEGLGIPLKAVDDIDVIDVTVDGADEVDTNFNGIKRRWWRPSYGKNRCHTNQRIHLGC